MERIYVRVTYVKVATFIKCVMGIKFFYIFAKNMLFYFLQA